MTRSDRRLGVAGCLALAAASVILLSSCAAVTTASGPAGSSAPPTPTTPSEVAASLVTIDVPELAPYPDPSPPLTEAESEAKRVADADAQWQGLLSTYPNAVRPPDPFAGYLTEEERKEPLRACLEAAGVAIDEGRSLNPDDPPSIGWSTSTEAQTIAAFTCSATHPTKITRSGPNDAELGWIYDYMVAFFAPCYEANGIDVPPPPGREVWVETWPGYVWFPSYHEDPRFRDMTFELETAIREACPDPDTYLQAHPELH
ncbi:hypothetical protein [Agromyces salentinus]|uniref:hypothetical protein n=1 Tax=Agromyces salentinus TaxID=269421 RepID=UPI0012FC91ED|nr:hypothetical protein [Agromyces salentinus]